MKSKFNPELLKEEMNKFRLLSEYDFYDEKKDIPEYKELIVGDEDLDEADETPEDDANTDSDASEIADDLGVGDDMGDDNGEMGDDQSQEEPVDAPVEAPIEEPAPMPEPVDDGIEVDVTELVKGSEEAKQSADLASHNTELLLQKLADLESRVGSMDKVSAKIDSLEQEMIKRNPTPVEKLEMRSLSSYPYSQKLTDYWAEKEGPYDVMNNEKKEKEYTLTQDDIDSDYSDSTVKQTFDVNPDDENDYEEEDI